MSSATEPKSWSAQGMALQVQSEATGSGMVGQSLRRRLLDVAPLNLTDPNTSIELLNQAIYSFLGGYQILGPPNLPQVLPDRLHSQLRCPGDSLPLWQLWFQQHATGAEHSWSFM